MRTRWVLVLAVLVLGAAGAWRLRGTDEGTGYRLLAIERGDLETVVSSTGTLQATTTVQVGTQVSGQVAEILVDFNEPVTAGQLVARIDATLLQQEVRAAQASLNRSRAEAQYTQQELDRILALRERDVASDAEVRLATYNRDVAQSGQESAQVGLSRAERNLAYAEIRSPIDGIVVDRTVDVGQTVAASLSAPQLFLIAGDLSRMEILASVDESDIGSIFEGQPVRFTVQAYPDDTFEGQVRQVRLQSAALENVVSYTVVVEVDNREGRLLPGMTATTDFIVGREENVLTVANAALRFRATEGMWAAFREGQPGGGDAPRGAAAAADADGQERRGAGGREGRTLLWSVDEEGRVTATPVRTGITNGQATVVEGDGIQEGMQVIAGITTSSTKAVSSPFQTGSADRRRGPPGM